MARLEFNDQRAWKSGRASTSSGAAHASTIMLAQNNANQDKRLGEERPLTMSNMIQTEAVQVRHMFVEGVVHLAAVFARRH